MGLLCFPSLQSGTIWEHTETEILPPSPPRNNKCSVPRCIPYFYFYSALEILCNPRQAVPHFFTQSTEIQFSIAQCFYSHGIAKFYRCLHKIYLHYDTYLFVIFVIVLCALLSRVILANLKKNSQKSFMWTCSIMQYSKVSPNVPLQHCICTYVAWKWLMFFT